MGKRKVLLVGWDAADWKIINPLMAAGKMPNLKRMVDGGVSGNLATLYPVLSPMLWTSIATGKRPYKHGIHGFSEPDPITGGIRPVTNLSRKTKAVWNILNQHALNTITVGWWPSNPAEELSHGVMVSNDYQTAAGNDPEKWPLKPGTIHPGRLAEKLAELRFHPAELNEEDLRPFLPGLDGMSREELDKAQKDPRVQSLMKIVADCTSVHSAATALMQNEPWDLMCVYQDAIDHFGHAFMKYHPPKRKHIDEWDYRVFNGCVEGGYRYHDMMLGTLLALAGDDTTVILMSDHGFHPDDQRLTNIPREPAGPAAEHRQFGIFVATGPGLKQGERLYGAGMLDICPTLLHLFGLPAGDDMDGAALLDIYQTTPAPAETLPSWDEVEGDHGMHPPDRQIAPAESKAALDQLVALGYIEEPNEDASKALEQTVRELDYNLAQAYVDGGIYNEAIALLERLHNHWPMEHRFGFALAGCYQAQNRARELRALVNTVIERRLSQAKEAAEEIKALKLDDEKERDAERERVKAMDKCEQAKFAKERNALLARASPNLYTLRYLEAYADYAEHDYAKALTKLDKLDSELGARRNALCLRGEIHSKLRAWGDARGAFGEALDIDPENPAALLGLARVALGERDFTTAADRAAASLDLVFFQPRAHYIRGLALYRCGRIDESEHSLFMCLRQAPLFSAAYRLLAQIAQLHRHDPANTTFYREQVKESRKRLRELNLKRREEAAAPEQTSEQRPMPELLPRPEVLEGVPADQIITIVSGLPRSGTSLMMQILEAAGIAPHTDSKRAADESNQRGYYEHEAVTALMRTTDRSWLREACGKALKVVAPLLSALPMRAKGDDGSPERLHYRVVFMERPLEDILDSQAKMLERLGRPQESSAGASKAFLQQVRHAKTWCAARGIPAIRVSFPELLSRNPNALAKIANFFQDPEIEAAAGQCIDPSMPRSGQSND